MGGEEVFPLLDEEDGQEFGEEQDTDNGPELFSAEMGFHRCRSVCCTDW